MKALLLLLALLVALTSGCSSSPGLKGFSRGKVIVLDETAFQERGIRAANAAKTGGKAGWECLGNSASMMSGCGGEFCGLALLIIAPVCAAWSLGNMAVGAAKEPTGHLVSPTESVAVSTLPAEVRSEAVHGPLRKSIESCLLEQDQSLVFTMSPTRTERQLTDAGRRYLSAFGVETTITIAVKKVRLAADNQSNLRYLYMEASVQAARVEDGNVTGTAHFAHKGEPRLLNEIREDNYQLLVESIERGYRDLADQICRALAKARREA